MSLVFVGGWATSSEQFPDLPGPVRFLVPFTGFEPCELPALIGGGGDVLVGWSTGAHMLLKDCRHLFGLYKKVILIAPFLTFTDSFPQRLVRSMIAGMDKEPAVVVRSFHENCGEPDPPDYDQSQKDALIAGLEFLISSKIAVEDKIVLPNLTIVRPARDRIVRRKAFERLTSVVKGAGIVEIDSGHKVSVLQLMNLIKD